jgi:hypothetical protein
MRAEVNDKRCTRLKQNDFYDLRTHLLETAVPFYEQFAEEKAGDAQSEANRAGAYARLASIHGETGQFERSVRWTLKTGRADKI